jgi:queuine/archaeosine tRNA-ribosyltransferase
VVLTGSWKEIRLALDEGRFEEFRKAFYEKRAGKKD